jgi:hypothetical protein
MDRFLIECDARVKAGTMAQRTLDDYRNAIEIRQRKDGKDAVSGTLRTYFAPPMTPLGRHAEPHQAVPRARRPGQAARRRPIARRRASRRSCPG